MKGVQQNNIMHSYSTVLCPPYRPMCADVRSHCLFWEDRKAINFFSKVDNWVLSLCKNKEKIPLDHPEDPLKNPLQGVQNWVSNKKFFLPTDREGTCDKLRY